MMGGLSRQPSSPRKPALSPKIIEEEDPVPPFFLDETSTLSAGIESSPSSSRPKLPRMNSSMGSSLTVPIPSIVRKKKVSNFNLKSGMRSNSMPSAMRKSQSLSGPSSAAGRKLKKFVRFLDRVEVVPVPNNDDNYDTEGDSDFEPHNFKKLKTAPEPMFSTPGRFYDDLDDDDDDDDDDSDFDDLDDDIDEGIASGLGRAGSPNKSPNRSPTGSVRDLNSSSKDNSHLSIPKVELWTPPSPPPSWRIPPETLLGRQPFVHSPPRVRSPLRPDEEIDLMARDSDHDSSRDSGCFMDSSEDETEEVVRPGVSYVRPQSPPRSPIGHGPPPIYPVIARKMWSHGEVRYEDQWGRRLVPVEHKDSFRFDLWPVEEDVAGEGASGAVRGAWVKGRGGRRRQQPPPK